MTDRKRFIPKFVVIINLSVFMLLNLLSSVSSDTLTLKSGRTIKGLITQEDEDKVVIKIDIGTVTFKKTQILKLEYDPDYLLESADNYFKKKDYKKAINTYEAILDNYQDKDNSTIKYRIAQCYIGLKLPDKALAYLEELKESRLKEEAKVLLSQIREKKEKINLLYQQAEEEYNRIKSLKWHYTNLPKYNKVIEDCNKVIEELPHSELALKAQHLIVLSYEEQAEYKKRFKALDKYTDMVANYYNKEKAAETLKEIADKLFDEREYEEAQEHYELLIKKYPETNLVDYAQYKIVGCVAQTDESRGGLKGINTYRKCQAFLEDYPDSKYIPDVLAEISFFYLRNQQYEKEIAVLRRIIKDYPDYYKCDWAQYNIFLAYYYQERYDEAKKEYEILLKDYPESGYIECAQRYLERLSG